MNEEESLPTSALRAPLSPKEQYLKKLLQRIQARTSATTKDLQAYEAYCTLSAQLGAAPNASTTGGAPRVVVRRGQPMTSGIVSNLSVQAKAPSGGTATLGKRSSSSMTSAKETSASATYSSGPTGGTSTHRSKAGRSV